MTELVAPRLVTLIERFIGAPLPIRVRAWDGSEAGAPGIPVVAIRDPRALRRMLWRPGELGLARAFVAGELDVEGDLTEALRRVWRLVGTRIDTRRRVAKADLLKLALEVGVVGPPPRPPAAETRLSGRLHTLLRDRLAIAHHYDLSNDFYQLILDPAMTYSCAYWTEDPTENPGYRLADAQRDKLDLICRKLDLQPGMRLLDVGCGWGSLLIHAATYHGVHGVGVTASRAGGDYATGRVAELGLSEWIDIRVQDYREVDDEPFDAVASLEMSEHVGKRNYPEYTAALHRQLRPGGRLLLQHISRGQAGGDYSPGGGVFIERYLAPDMHMRPVGDTIAMLESAGHDVVDVQSLREHYYLTLRAWLAKLQANKEQAIAMIGEDQYRVWQLYMAGAALSFEQNRMGLHQVLAVRPSVDGGTGLPLQRSALLGDQRVSGGSAVE